MVPPLVTLAVADPLELPQYASSMEVVNVISVGSPILADPIASHPLASVNVAIKDPALKFINEEVVDPFDHR